MSGRRISQFRGGGGRSNGRRNNASPAAGRTVAGLGEITHARLSSDVASTSRLSATPPALATAAGTLPCSSCEGVGFVAADGLVSVLQKLKTPLRISVPPGPAPTGTRWVCPLCPGIKQIKTKSGDLRLHLRNSPHFFSWDDTEVVFDPARSTLYQHFGPCTVEQAAENGWCVRPWKDVYVTATSQESGKPTGMSRLRDLFLRELGMEAVRSFSAGTNRNTLNGPTLHGWPASGLPTSSTTRDESVWNMVRGVDCDASNDYFASGLPTQDLPQTPVLLAAGTRFKDVPYTEASNVAPGIEEFGIAGAAGKGTYPLQEWPAMLGLLEAPDGARTSLMAPTSWNNSALTNPYEDFSHLPQRAVSARVAERESWDGTTPLNAHSYVHCGHPYRNPAPSMSVADDADEVMFDAATNSGDSFEAYLYSSD
ncbi:hypothetical protein PMZ80_007130 [Knufia obscura]|uniref:Uncharacterized protein n=1 Tax=Knufia obscura TaxID=1635080 RepID=A0ABR0RKB6_9EURO|nr:hypothetical protein PMZ80_007130 [Knufia obscura]